jgi:hypothetical protein
MRWDRVSNGQQRLGRRLVTPQLMRRAVRRRQRNRRWGCNITPAVFVSWLALGGTAGCGTDDAGSANSPRVSADTTKHDSLQLVEHVEKDIIDAANLAFGLETELHAQRDKMRSRDDVYEHFRQGFGSGLAGRYVDYWWSLERDSLFVDWPQQNVVTSLRLLRLVGDTAIVAGNISVDPYRYEDTRPFIVAYLVHESDRWVIMRTERADSSAVRGPPA